MTEVVLVAEDDLSMAVAVRVIASSNGNIHVSNRVVARGFGNIKRSIRKYRQASRVVPHVVLTDLDRMECPATLRREWQASDLPKSMLFCVAVHETESWLLADRHGFAQFAKVPANKVPAVPEALQDPKAALLRLVRNSRSRRLATELLPAHGSAASIGPLYNERLIGFVRIDWDIEVATAACASLQRMRARLAEFPA